MSIYAVDVSSTRSTEKLESPSPLHTILLIFTRRRKGPFTREMYLYQRSTNVKRTPVKPVSIHPPSLSTSTTSILLLLNRNPKHNSIA